MADKGKRKGREGIATTPSEWPKSHAFGFLASRALSKRPRVCSERGLPSTQRSQTRKTLKPHASVSVVNVGGEC